MVYLSTTEEWQRQSALLLQARPTTTRITTKYKIPNLESAKYNKKRKRTADESEGAAASRVPKARLVLKTYDPESGVVLKLQTDRAAEVGRLITGLGRLGRHMAALPEASTAPEARMEDAPAAPATKDAASTDAKPQQQAGGGKKKKKGKK